MIDIVAVTDKKTEVLYRKMAMAIADCHRLDDCKEIASQAAAIAAYHKQIKDDESVRKFLAIKLRAWRRIGELLNKIDASDCDGNVTAHIRKIRNAFNGDATVESLNDNAIRQALRVAALPEDFFEVEVGEGHSSVASMVHTYEQLQLAEWEASPEGQKDLKTRAAREETARIEVRNKMEKDAADQRQEARRWDMLRKAHDEALDEVGVTLERRDRERMREVLLLIKEPIHEALRQAAFDKRMTMQAVLRSGLAMWFIAHGYDVPMDLQPKPKARS